MDTTEDTLLGGRLRLRQLRRGHRAGTDAVLLAAAVPPGAGVAYDLGAGTGAVGLMVAARSEAQVVLVERDSALAALCRANAAANALDDRVSVIEADLLAPAARRPAGLLSETADIVVTNPPFLDEARARTSPEPRRAAAHGLPPEGFSRWVAACADLAKPKGRFVLIHRADRLAACLREVGRAFGSLRIRPVHPHADAPAIRILVVATKGSRAPLAILPPLVLHGEDGGFTPLAAALHRGEATLPE
ncbi:MAG TPA: methyltransferase [Beijerinckiaceae bacterium]|nr:methyltransferase [Beijerinckiaceae bacterium]